MTNFEKYGKNIIIDLIMDSYSGIDKKGNIFECSKDYFKKCDNKCVLQGNCLNKKFLEEWLNEEYNDVDWSKVPEDTKVLVSDDGVTWFKRYFARYVDKKPFVFNSGMTSWTVQDGSKVNTWKYTKLVED